MQYPKVVLVVVTINIHIQKVLQTCVTDCKYWSHLSCLQCTDKVTAFNRARPYSLCAALTKQTCHRGFICETEPFFILKHRQSNNEVTWTITYLSKLKCIS